MSLRDELMNIPVESQEIISDSEIYQILLNAMYQKYIKDIIIGKYKSGAKRIESKFLLECSVQKEIIDKIIRNRKYNRNSNVYYVSDEYDGYPGAIGFKPLYTMEKTGVQFTTSKKRIILTSLGLRVYNDLKQMAQSDGVTLSEPLPYYYTQYNSLGGSTKTYSCSPKLNEYFTGKDPGHVNHSRGYSVSVSFSFIV